jgi:serine/threonine-protein kinase
LRPVVLKQALRGHDEAEEVLEREARLASFLNHPNLVHVYELFETEGHLVLAMEYASGLSVHRLLASLTESDGRVPWPIAARVVSDAARGLAHAHRARDATGASLGIIHRDVSPKNLVVTDDGITKVLDFGIARSALHSVTVQDVVKGTLGYLSPEQATGQPLSPRTDVFSLGAVFVELLTRERLFRGPDARSTMQAVLSSPIPPLPDVPATIRDVIGWMLVRDPAHRTIELDQVADALDAATVGYGGGHRDVATFLAAECGPLLERRRRGVAELMRGERREPVPRPSSDETSTMILLESALELGAAPSPASISDEHPVLGSDADDTILDEAATEIDLPD